MSRRPINRSPDLKRLRDEGYDIEYRSGFLIVYGVPRSLRRSRLTTMLLSLQETIKSSSRARHRIMLRVAQ
jgi:hypothetical protein